MKNDNLRNIAIIPARGGSKRIPRKNIKNFFGKPIIAYSIEVAIKSNIFDEVMVSTEDKEIAKIAQSFGAKVPFFRDMELAKDDTTTADVLISVIKEYEKRNLFFKNVCCIYPAAPFVTEILLEDALNIFEKSNNDSLIPVTRFSYPPQRGFLIEDDKIKCLNKKILNCCSQSLETIYHDCGLFYFIKTDILLKEKSLLTKNTKPFFINNIYAQDIDNFEDWELAEIKFQAIKNKNYKIS